MLLTVLEESGFPFPPVDLALPPSPASGLEGAESIALSLEVIAERERRRQMPLLGPPPGRARNPLGRATISAAWPRPASASPSPALLAAHGWTLEGIWNGVPSTCWTTPTPSWRSRPMPRSGRSSRATEPVSSSPAPTVRRSGRHSKSARSGRWRRGSSPCSPKGSFFNVFLLKSKSRKPLNFRG